MMNSNEKRCDEMGWTGEDDIREDGVRLHKSGKEDMIYEMW